MLTCGRFTSGGAKMLGSMASLGFRLLYTATGGVNCRSDALGRRPLLAGNGDRSPPPPPPCMVWFFGGMSGGATSIGAMRVKVCLTLSCTDLLAARMNRIVTTVIWKPVDIMKDFFWRP